jgi:hypothetical protein
MEKQVEIFIIMEYQVSIFANLHQAAKTTAIHASVMSWVGFGAKVGKMSFCDFG